MDLTGALNWLKLSPKYLVAITIATGAILFAPENLLTFLGMTEIKTSYKSWLGLGFIIAASLLIANLFFYIVKWVITRITWRRNRVKCQTYLNDLTSDELEILREYIGTQSRTQYLPIDSGVVQGLVGNKIIYRSANVGDMVDGWAFNIQPWAWDYLNVNLHLLFDLDEINNFLTEGSLTSSSKKTRRRHRAF